MKKWLLVFIPFVLSIFLFLTFSIFADEKEVEGVFQSEGYNNPLDLDRLKIYDDSLNPVVSLSPQRNYLIQLDLNDLDSIADIKRLDIVFYYASEASSDIESLIDNGTDPSGEVFVASWERGNVVEDPFSATTPNDLEIKLASGTNLSDITWEITSSTTPAILGDFEIEKTTQNFRFEMEFKVSKVAPQTSQGEWRIGFLAEDGLVPNESPLVLTSKAALEVGDDPLSANQSVFNMNWFGEVSGIDSSSLIDWSGVQPPLPFGGSNSLATIESIIFISNGAYDRQTGASDYWEIINGGMAVDGSTRAALSTDTTLSPQTFGLKTGIAEDTNYDVLNEAVNIAPSLNGVFQYSSLGSNQKTSESGNSYTFQYWLSLSEFFQNATYRGDIQIKINNSLDVAQIGATNYRTFTEALSAASSGDTIKLISDITGDFLLDQPLNIDFNGFKIQGDLDITFNDTATIDFTGMGQLDGNLTIDAPNLTFNSDLIVLGDTVINAISNNSFNSSGIHRNGVTVSGSARVNLTNAEVKSNVIINTTENIILDGFIDVVSIQINNADVSIEAIVNELDVNALNASLSISENASIQNPSNYVINQRSNQFYGSIQSAIDEANAGDTLMVSDGIYDEYITINKENLSLIATSGHTPTLQGTIEISKDGVRVDGFNIQPNLDETYETFKIKNVGIRVYGSNVIIENNTIGNYSYMLPGDGSQRSGTNGTAGIQVYQADGPLTNITIRNNVIENIVSPLNSTSGGFGFEYGMVYGIFIQGDVSGGAIESNIIRNLSSSGFTNGITLGSTASNVTQTTDNNPRYISITNNTIASLTAGTTPNVGFGLELGAYTSEIDVQQNAFVMNQLGIDDMVYVIQYKDDSTLQESIIQNNQFYYNNQLIQIGSGLFNQSGYDPNNNQHPAILSELVLAKLTPVPDNTILNFSQTLRDGTSAVYTTLLDALTVANENDLIIVGKGSFAGTQASTSVAIIGQGESTIFTSNLFIEHPNTRFANFKTTARITSEYNDIDISNLVIDHVYFDGTNQAVFLGTPTDQSGVNLMVSNIRIMNSTFDNNGQKGIYIEKGSDIYITNNRFINAGGSDSRVWSAAIDINLKFRDYTGTIQISGNFISGAGVFSDTTQYTDGHKGGAILIKARDDGSYSSTKASFIGDILIFDNEIIHSRVALQFGEPVKGGIPGSVTPESGTNQGLSLTLDMVQTYLNNNTFSNNEYDFIDYRLNPVLIDGLFYLESTE